MRNTRHYLEAGDWVVANTEFIAMQAKIAQLEKQLKAVPKSRSNPASQGRNIYHKNKTKGSVPTKIKDNGYQAAWRYQPPKDGKTKSITKDGKHFIWCDKHQKWGSHKTSNCKGVGIGKGADNSRTKFNKYKGSKTKGFSKFSKDASQMKLQLSKAYANMAIDNSSDDESQE